MTHERIHGKARDPYRLTADGVARVASAVLNQPVRDCLDWLPAATWNPRAKSVDARLRFCGIREFMYGQLCISLIEGRRFQQCRPCGKWFQLAPGVGRADKTTCSSSCRFTAYRRRRQQALQLHGKGWSVKEIAKEIGSGIGKVRRWISKAKE